jgi:membrane-associated phospholipid phosphatase
MRWRRGSAGARGVALCLVVLAAAVPLDTRLHDLVFRYVDSHEARLAANGFTLLGTGWAATGLLASLALVAHRAGDVELLRASVGGLGGLVIAGLGGQIVKHVACRGRPKLLDGWGIDPGRPSTGEAGTFFHTPCLVDARYQSFPSGHATTAFAVAAALARAVPARRRVWVVVAGGVALSRVLLNAHFLSDVLSGALLGWWGGQLGQRLVDRVAPAPWTLGRLRAATPAGRDTPRA